MKDKFRLYKLMQSERDLGLCDFYMLDGHTPVKIYSTVQWGTTFERYNRVVARDTVDVNCWFYRLCGLHDRYWIATDFIGLDYNIFGDEVHVFETMVRHQTIGQWTGYQTRCATWEQAEAMHEKAIHWLLSNNRS